jgi:Flp pilus assembly pilin Flp
MNQLSNIGAVRSVRRGQTPRLRVLQGQGMTEYIIIVALVAVAAIGVYTLLGQTLRNQTAGLALELSGQDGGTAINNAQGNANSAQGGANQRKGLDTYNAQNRP